MTWGYSGFFFYLFLNDENVFCSQEPQFAEIIKKIKKKTNTLGARQLQKWVKKNFFRLFYNFPIIYFNVQICMLSFRIFRFFLEKYLFLLKKNYFPHFLLYKCNFFHCKNFLNIPYLCSDGYIKLF